MKSIFYLPKNTLTRKILSDWSNATFKKIINWLYSKFVLEA